MNRDDYEEMRRELEREDAKYERDLLLPHNYFGLPDEHEILDSPRKGEQ